MKNKTEVYKLLAKQFSTPQAVVTEIINLQAILNLPKGTEHFLSDLHGEAEVVRHILRNASGVIRTKIDIAFSTSLTEEEKDEQIRAQARDELDQAIGTPEKLPVELSGDAFPFPKDDNE